LRGGVNLHYGLKNRIARRVAEIYGMEKHEVFSKGWQQRRVKAKSLLCFCAVREIAMSLRELAGQLEMNDPGVGLAVERGKTIAHRNGHTRGTLVPKRLITIVSIV